MLGKRSPQRGLFEADHLYLDWVGRKSFYGWLASQRGQLFRDEDFVALYCPNNGRPSVPPSLLATALLLQWYDDVSDEEARDSAKYDDRWRVALGLEQGVQPFAKSTLQLFRAQLLVHDQAAIFQRVLELATERGLLKRGQPLKVAQDTTPILGRGAVKDTINLLGDGIVLVLRELAKQAGAELEALASREGLKRYVTGSSLKGEADIDWTDADQRQHFLRTVVADADRVLEVVRQRRRELEADSAQDRALAEAAGLLSQVLAQDIERTQDEGPTLHHGVSRDRMPSVHDPDVRHGRKSKRKRFDGHKAAVVVDTDTQIIVAMDVHPGNTPDQESALALVEQAEANTGCPVEETIGDCAYGAGATRQEFADAGRTLVASVPATTNQGRFPKTDFQIDVGAGTCTCPAKQVTTTLVRYRTGGGHFEFAASVCQPCPLRPHCVRGQGGRTVQLHPQERLLQQARALQASPPFRDYRRRRQVAEHAIARLVQRGLRQARYRGVPKTLFQALMAAAVVNLTLIAGLVGAFWSLWLRLPPAIGAFWALPALHDARLPCAVFLPQVVGRAPSAA
jgi:hypothetical protein